VSSPSRYFPMSRAVTVFVLAFAAACVSSEVESQTKGTIGAGVTVVGPMSLAIEPTSATVRRSGSYVEVTAPVYAAPRASDLVSVHVEDRQEDEQDSAGPPRFRAAHGRFARRNAQIPLGTGSARTDMQTGGSDARAQLDLRRPDPDTDVRFTVRYVVIPMV
jgi:hypothetical protein